MSPKYYIIALSATFSLLSCKEELQPQENSAAVRADQNPAAAAKTAAVTPTSQQTATAQTTTPATTQAQGPLNPAHGQPGHRCDIAVGAPLGNKPATTQATATPTQTITPQNLQTTQQITTTPAKTAKGMNPPHGQPGHRCDIAVGAPLNSKPNTATPAKATTTNPSYTVTPNGAQGTPSLLAPPAATTAPTTETAPGMNPPHGQPGHVCGIPVGSPLNGEKKEEKKP